MVIGKTKEITITKTMGITVFSIASLHSVSIPAYAGESLRWAASLLRSHWILHLKKMPSARMRNPVLFKTHTYGDLMTGVREDKAGERGLTSSVSARQCAIVLMHTQWARASQR